MRPRKPSKLCPAIAYLRIRSGSYVYRNKAICRVSDGLEKLYDELAKIQREDSSDMIPSCVARFKRFHLPHLSPSAKAEHERILDVFAAEFDEFSIGQVHAPDIRRSITNLYPGKDTAARAYKARISSFFSWAVTVEGIIAVNPTREIRLKKPKVKPMLWTAELFWAIRDRLEPMHQVYHDLSLLVHQRTTDIRLLELTSIDGDTILFEPSKVKDSSGAKIRVPITPDIRDALDRASQIVRERATKRNRIVPTRYVICQPDGDAYTRSGIYSAYRRADADLHGGKPIGLNPKALLRFACQWADKLGHTLRQIQIGRGHTDIKTTQGYLANDEEKLSELMMIYPPKTGGVLSK